MSKHGLKQPGLDGRHRDSDGAIRAKRADTLTLGLRAFEKISAVEGVSLTGQMRRDAQSMSAKRLSEIRKK